MAMNIIIDKYLIRHSAKGWLIRTTKTMKCHNITRKLYDKLKKKYLGI